MMKKVFLITVALVGLFVFASLNNNESGSYHNETIKNLMERRSIRSYSDKPVPKIEMDAILECGIYAPSAVNRQPWEIRVVDNKEFIDGVTKLYVEKNPDNKMVKEPNFKNAFRNAPTVAFIALKEGEAEINCGLLIQNMLIAAQSLGIGSCCLGGIVPFMKTDASEYLEKLEFSDDYQLVLAVAFGYPDSEAPKAPKRDYSKIRYID